MYYFAYGSNLNVEQMALRCPDAEPVGPMVLPKARLVFKGVADVEYDEASEVHGGIWKITDKCLAALDRYEGCRPDGNGLYRRHYLKIAVGGKTRRALVYLMNREEYGLPSPHYYNVIREGYADFELDEAHLKAAWNATKRELGRFYTRMMA